MDYDFGHNCSFYIAELGKCSDKIYRYRTIKYLLNKKSLTTWQLLKYMGSSHDELLEKISIGTVEVRRVTEDQSLRYELSTSWAWDDCPLAKTGGQCSAFKPHQGRKITCIKDLEQLRYGDSDQERAVLDIEIRAFEDRIPITMIQVKPNKK